jgi:hypothetical protein
MTAAYLSLLSLNSISDFLSLSFVAAEFEIDSVMHSRSDFLCILAAAGGVWSHYNLNITIS